MSVISADIQVTKVIFADRNNLIGNVTYQHQK